MRQLRKPETGLRRSWVDCSRTEHRRVDQPCGSPVVAAIVAARPDIDGRVMSHVSSRAYPSACTWVWRPYRGARRANLPRDPSQGVAPPARTRRSALLNDSPSVHEELKRCAVLQAGHERYLDGLSRIQDAVRIAAGTRHRQCGPQAARPTVGIL